MCQDAVVSAMMGASQIQLPTVVRSRCWQRGAAFNGRTPCSGWESNPLLSTHDGAAFTQSVAHIRSLHRNSGPALGWICSNTLPLQ